MATPFCEQIQLSSQSHMKSERVGEPGGRRRRTCSPLKSAEQGGHGFPSSRKRVGEASLHLCAFIISVPSCRCRTMKAPYRCRMMKAPYWCRRTGCRGTLYAPDSGATASSTLMAYTFSKGAPKIRLRSTSRREPAGRRFGRTPLTVRTHTHSHTPHTHTLCASTHAQTHTHWMSE